MPLCVSYNVQFILWWMGSAFSFFYGSIYNCMCMWACCSIFIIEPNSREIMAAHAWIMWIFVLKKKKNHMNGCCQSFLQYSYRDTCIRLVLLFLICKCVFFPLFKGFFLGGGYDVCGSFIVISLFDRKWYCYLEFFFSLQFFILFYRVHS